MSEAGSSAAGRMTEDHPGWQGILDADERILWQGKPDSKPRIAFDRIGEAMPGLFFVAFSLFWMYQVAQMNLMFSLFGLIFLVVGLRRLVEPLLMPAYIRSRSWYTLTDRRAFVATDMPFRGRRLVSYPIEPGTSVEFVDGDPPSILFSAADRGGFRFIENADEVMRLIRQIQQVPASDGGDR